ncbi:hypothetical protein FO519_000789 [Halicephalobus sp. NKZ332]|nr:hypothetical protein FO519_000789 [Halicephalobus sp. NKZ332]
MDFISFLNISENVVYVHLGPDVILYNALVMIAGIIDVVLVGLLVKALIVKRGYHTNVKILLANVIFGLFLVGFSNVLQTLAVLCGYFKMEHATVLLILGNAVVYGPNLWRISFFCFTVERSVATLRASSYETGGNIFLGVFLTILAQLITLFLGLNYYCFNFDMYYQLGILFSIDILNIITLIILMKINKSKRKINIKSQIALSQRYQIVENIRVLKFLFPLIMIGITCNVGGIISTVFQSIYDPVQMLKTNGYTIINVLYPMVSFLVIFKTDNISQRRIRGLCGKIGETESIDSLSTASQKRPEIKNAVGQNLIPQASPEKHFEQLKSMWK